MTRGLRSTGHREPEPLQLSTVVCARGRGRGDSDAGGEAHPQPSSGDALGPPILHKPCYICIGITALRRARCAKLSDIPCGTTKAHKGASGRVLTKIDLPVSLTIMNGLAPSQFVARVYCRPAYRVQPRTSSRCEPSFTGTYLTIRAVLTELGRGGARGRSVSDFTGTTATRFPAAQRSTRYISGLSPSSGAGVLYDLEQSPRYVPAYALASSPSVPEERLHLPLSLQDAC
ncbi:hypothetical protein C2E23DRAFT_862581 [Lenzites betulinus]|nr:hypothetical protein C2E23DRAFT_862581 [Lenzites betulinus]